MGKSFEFISSWVRFIFAPEAIGWRVLRRGFIRENSPVWVFLIILFLSYQVALSGGVYNLYLPYEHEWIWQKVDFPLLGFWSSAGALLFASGICFFPRATSYISAVVFAFYFFYGAGNSAPVDFLFGVAEPFGVAFRPVLSPATLKSLSVLWDSVHFPALELYAFHYYLTFYIFFTAFLTFIYFPARKRSPQDRPSTVDILLCVVTLVFTVEYIVNFADRGQRAGMVLWPDVLMGTMAILISIEMCRRIMGWVLPLLAVTFFLYTLYGNYVPGRLAHKGFAYNEVVTFIYSNDGIFGIIANVYASYVFLFILFGVFLEKTRVGDVFVDLAFALVGRLRGGPAKAAIVSSGLVGSIVGSGAANIVITGTFTIPMMKRAGYRAHFAAAVEAVASIGGHLMPPVMGSAAFLLAAFTETDYGYIILISLVPALMYYFSLYMSVHFRSGLEGIHGLPREELPQLGLLLKRDGYLLLPVLLLILRLIIGRSPFDAALWAILLAMFLGMFREDTRLIALPPIIARALGVPEWNTESHWAMLLAKEKKSTLIRDGMSREEAEAEAAKILAEAKSAPPRGLLQENWMLGVSLALLVFLPALGFGIVETLFWTIVGTTVLASPQIMHGLEKGALDCLSIGVTAGVMGIVLAGVSMPGLGLKFSSIILDYSSLLNQWFGWQGSELPMGILLCAIASYILGMGMTITASYILLSILAVPALVELGVPLLSAHLIILWLSQDASLTPPFALGAFIAAGVAKADPMRTGFSSLKLAKALYIVPFLMAYTPILMDKGSTWPAILLVWSTGFMGFFCSSAALEGYLRRKLFIWERFLFVFAATFLFFNAGWMKGVGTVLMAIGLGVQFFHRPDTEVSWSIETSR